MVEAFQNAVMRLAMCGLGVSLAAMALRSRPVRVAFARMLVIWRGLTAFGRLAVCSFLLVGILVGGGKKGQTLLYKLCCICLTVGCGIW